MDELEGKEHATAFITRQAVRFVEEIAAETSKPFFLWLSYTAPHSPHEVRRESTGRKGQWCIARRGEAAAWEELQAARLGGWAKREARIKPGRVEVCYHGFLRLCRRLKRSWTST